jgi:transcriptional regulator with XRE-family HTH domain
MNKNAVRKRLRKRIKEVKTQQAFAKINGLTKQYVSDMVNGRRDFSERVLEILDLHIDYVEND